MAYDDRPGAGEPPAPQDMATDGRAKRRFDWKAMLGNRNSNKRDGAQPTSGDTSETEIEKGRPPTKWNMGMLNDRETDEVPGSVLLMSKVSEYNEPLGLRNAPARTSASSLPSQTGSQARSSSRASSCRYRSSNVPDKKRTEDGQIVLEPQPADSHNDPLNWQVWRRDLALYSLGFYCMVGGGQTTVLAAGFNNVASDYHISEPRVALTTGLYMMGLGLGSVVLSPTAILYGKRPVYLVAATCFVLSAMWCALSPNFASLICARIFQGIAVSSVECLPSATIAEIYFLHEKGYRLGIYTLLLLGGKNLVPLVSASIIGSLGWRWAFWMVAIIVSFAGVLLFFFVPETFWDRTPVVKKRRSRPRLRRGSTNNFDASQPSSPTMQRKPQVAFPDAVHTTSAYEKPNKLHAHFGDDEKADVSDAKKSVVSLEKPPASPATLDPNLRHNSIQQVPTQEMDFVYSNGDLAATESNEHPVMPSFHRQNSTLSNTSHHTHDPRNEYTRQLDSQPKQSYIQQLRPWSGRRLSPDNWFKVALRPFVLYAYPNILWSALVYALSVGWLIVLSESVTTIYKSADTYNFTALQAGLVYISPFIGGILGTAVAGKFSDIIVRWLARKNGGLYEPEFRLIMAIPITISTVIGLMGYGWSVEEHDAWIVPTVFFGIISFGCCVGSTTAITFAVDSYRQYAGEALVTLNFSKNILHGLVWSLFFNDWLQSSGSKNVFIAIGGIQLACMFTTIPMYIYGKRSRMWTVRRNLMEKL